MENYDPRRRQANQDQARYSPQNEERDRESQREASRGDDRERRDRGQTGWLDYDRDYGRSDERYRGSREQQQRYGQGSERSTFSPDWSREGAEARRSDEPYYSRNRERERGDYSRGGSGDYARAGSGDYNSPEWPYERGNRGRDVQRSRDDEQDSHYRGYYSRSSAPFSYSGGTGYVYSESWTLHGPYTGRGPKGYKRSDQQIIEEASHRLERDGEIDATEIEVLAEDGVLVLRGTVEDRRTKRRAEECVESVYGVRDVMNELRISPQRGEGSQALQGSQASQGSQKAKGARGSQTSQASQTSQSPAGSQAGRVAGAAATEPSGESERPKH